MRAYSRMMTRGSDEPTTKRSTGNPDSGSGTTFPSVPVRSNVPVG
jgi:hypothetical protein